MSHIAREAEKLEKRLRRITETPDPTKLKSNKTLYELQLQLRQAQIAAIDNRTKPISLSSEWMEPLLRALGFQPIDYQDFADKLVDGSSYLEAVRETGFYEDSCDRVCVYLAMLKRGDLPLPDFVPVRYWNCEMIYLSQVALVHLFNIPHFVIDHGLEINNDNLAYVAAQLRELIEYVERNVPGTKFDDEKLAELVALDAEAGAILRETFQLRRLVPTPTTVEDTFRIPRFPSHYEDPHRGLSYVRQYHAEIQARVGALSQEHEKLRVMWTMTAPFYAKLFDVLERRGARIVCFGLPEITRFFGKGYFYGDTAEFGRKLAPLEEIARTSVLAFGSYGQRWLDDLVWACRDLKIDAVVNFMQVGCTPTYSLTALATEEVRETLGIPVLNLEGRQLYSEFTDTEKLERELEEFIGICLRNKYG